ncbi:hypothetical protein NE237_024701 [Protea cynaroides]|uniref:Uncharacterized protein n=1 Tax=Protea cynaroides TaxID=273540 RepID=A0A9Q0K0N6_9MAGN|nr:hypothetical protein NE237_024701 [Protea cynaroides]
MLLALEPTADMLLALVPTSTCGEGNTQRMISGLKMSLNSNQWRKDAFREKIGELVDGGLKKLLKSECGYKGEQVSVDDLDKQEWRSSKRTKDWQTERGSKVNDLIDKLNKAQNEEDLKSCLVMKSKLFNQPEKANPTRRKEVEISKEKNAEDITPPKLISDYALPRLYMEVKINQETFCSVGIHFSSFNQI